MENDVNNRYDLLNIVIDVTRKTGQGLPGKLIRFKSSEYSQYFDELIEEGLITSHIEHYSHLPDDEWIMPTGDYYNLWETDNAHYNLNLVRFYLGQDDYEIGKIKINMRHDVDFMINYGKWLKENKDALEKMKNLEDYIPVDGGFNMEKISTWVKDRKWYKDDENISVCIDKATNWINNDSVKYKNTLEQLVELCKDSPKHKTEYEGYVKELEDFEKNLRTRKETISWMKTQKQDVNIKSVLNEC